MKKTTIQIFFKKVNTFLFCNIVKDKKGNTTCHITLTLNKNSLDMLPVFAEELKLRLSPIDFKYYRKNKK